MNNMVEETKNKMKASKQQKEKKGEADCNV